MKNPPKSDDRISNGNFSRSTLLQHEGREHRIGTGLIGATETSVTFHVNNHVKDDASGETSEPRSYSMYARLGGTANHTEVEQVLASLHETESARVFGSGMAAYSAVTLALLGPGDHVLVQENCYGGTHQLFTRLLSRLGIEITFAPLQKWKDHLKPNTRAGFFESISNPFCTPADVKEVATWARSQKILTVCDNTFASPANCRPCVLGVDITLESATKYLNGHSDVTAGVIAGRSELLNRIQEVAKFMGGFLPTPQAVQLLRGVRTFELRMDRHNQNGNAFATAMRSNPLVDKVYYGPEDLNSAEGQRIADQFEFKFGGMCTLRFAKKVDVQRLLKSLNLIADVPSLGGTESTVTMPLLTTNNWQSTEEHKALGIDGQVLRFSIGIENPVDIIADVEEAIKAAL